MLAFVDIPKRDNINLYKCSNHFKIKRLLLLSICLLFCLFDYLDAANKCLHENTISESDITLH